jgi:KDO2-lipid IV(A) lauroyltransferase
VADPNSGYRMQNEQRERAGFEVTPVSIQALKRATRRLEDGGVVITGLDRPLPEAPPDAWPRFFGERARLPLMHVRLAMRTGASIIVIAPILRPDGLYALRGSGHIEMEGTDQLANAERVLAVAEEFIGAAPSQWIMPHDVWPGTCVPGN